MGNMKFKVGDRVRIKSLDCIKNFREVTQDMLEHCEMIMTINDIHKASASYIFKEDCHKRLWSDEMIEGLVKDECPQDFIEKYCKSCGTQRCDRTKEYLNGCPYYNAYVCKKQNNDMKEETKPNIIEEAKTYWDSIKDAWICPEGYIFKDENGNIINATKIVLEKKKKEYPKTYEECCEVLGINSENFLSIRNVHRYDGEEETIKYERDLLDKFDSLWQLLICRDAYWKIAGEELGLGKPWEPDWNTSEPKYVIACTSNGIEKQWETTYCKGFAFPTEEMRDAFYENFKEIIESCKELL